MHTLHIKAVVYVSNNTECIHLRVLPTPGDQYWVFLELKWTEQNPVRDGRRCRHGASASSPRSGCSVEASTQLLHGGYGVTPLILNFPPVWCLRNGAA